ncbi:helix-turn-helix domain-containing protein [Arcobacter sp. F2176]|uniref:winged helix-turn-helix transcriptional regulator n=1 Tax=Arcobacter sp. F2176 TaxID=2044511 RepID=UPI00100B625B|nr:helix-turn-helix domain-containing protein [Arcobacter sp. F2176]RXJ81776.1 transcriptional regulator [Arcobacter sp. F2176]
MQIKYKEKDYTCSFEFVLDIVSGKWKGLVLWHLSKGTMRYNEIHKILGKITQKMLTQTLRDLEKHNLISRKVYPVIPPKVEYTITKNGEKLIPIFYQLSKWGDEMAEEYGEVKK